MPRTLRPTQPRWHVHLEPVQGNGQHRGRTEVNGRASELNFTRHDGWSVLHAAPTETDPLTGHFGKPGLWRTVGEIPQRVFELPPLPDLGEADEADREELLAECRAWALCTAHGKVPDGWLPPPRAEVETWIPAGGLTIRNGAQARQARLVYEPQRLALICPVLTSITPDLSPARRSWLRALLLDGQDRWRMVRLGLTETEAAAELDLTGAPPWMVESVFRTGLGALRWVVGWLVESAAFLADGANHCAALEVCPMRDTPAERRVVPC